MSSTFLLYADITQLWPKLCCHAVCPVIADVLAGKDIRSRREGEEDDRVCGIQKCCLMKSAHINIVCISKQELLSASQQRSRLLPLTKGDRSERAWGRGARVGAGFGKIYIFFFAPVCSCQVLFSSSEVI